MHNRANIEWSLPKDGTVTYEQAQMAILMDIRAELQKLNNLLYCPNFTNIPHKLERIARNTIKPKKRKRKVK